MWARRRCHTPRWRDTGPGTPRQRGKGAGPAEKRTPVARFLTMYATVALDGNAGRV